MLNIIDKSAVLEFSDNVIDHFGKVDRLINNAGIIQPFVRINDLDSDSITRLMNVNFYGTLCMTNAFLLHFFYPPEAHLLHI